MPGTPARPQGNFQEEHDVQQHDLDAVRLEMGALLLDDEESVEEDMDEEEVGSKYQQMLGNQGDPDDEDENADDEDKTSDDDDENSGQTSKDSEESVALFTEDAPVETSNGDDHGATKAPNKAIRDQFRTYAMYMSENHLDLSEDQKSAIRLLNILRQKKHHSMPTNH
jgi:hypothetical protein